MSNVIFVGIRSSLEKAFAGACSLKEQKLYKYYNRPGETQNR